MLATEALAANRESKTAEGVSGQLTTIEWRNSTISGSTDHSIARLYNNLAHSFRWDKKGRFGWKTIPIQLWERFNQLLTNFNNDDCAELTDDTVSLSTAKWKCRTEVTKFFKIHILYSPWIEHLSIRCKKFHDLLYTKVNLESKLSNEDLKLFVCVWGWGEEVKYTSYSQLQVWLVVYNHWTGLWIVFLHFYLAKKNIINTPWNMIFIFTQLGIH